MNEKQLTKRIAQASAGNPLLDGLAPLIAQVLFPLVGKCLNIDLASISGPQRARLEASIRAKLKAEGRPCTSDIVTAAAHTVETMSRNATRQQRASFLKSAEEFLTV